jgi:hypothetical protein
MSLASCVAVSDLYAISELSGGWQAIVRLNTRCNASGGTASVLALSVATTARDYRQQPMHVS